jgi:hypothetical protein
LRLSTVHEEERRACEQKACDDAAMSHANLPFDFSFDSAGPWIYPTRRRLFAIVRTRVSMFSFDGFRFGYLIASASTDGTTKLSKPELKLLNGQR